jgi:ribosomal protein L11 methyltransferase
MAAREDFIEVTIPVSRTFVAALESLMQAQGALAVTLRDVADVPVLEPPIGETPLWPEVMVSGLFPGQTPVKTATG